MHRIYCAITLNAYYDCSCGRLKTDAFQMNAVVKSFFGPRCNAPMAFENFEMSKNQKIVFFQNYNFYSV